MTTASESRRVPGACTVERGRRGSDGGGVGDAGARRTACSTGVTTPVVATSRRICVCAARWRGGFIPAALGVGSACVRLASLGGTLPVCAPSSAAATVSYNPSVFWPTGLADGLAQAEQRYAQEPARFAPNNNLGPRLSSSWREIRRLCDVMEPTSRSGGMRTKAVHLSANCDIPDAPLPPSQWPAAQPPPAAKGPGPRGVRGRATPWRSVRAWTKRPRRTSKPGQGLKRRAGGRCGLCVARAPRPRCRRRAGSARGGRDRRAGSGSPVRSAPARGAERWPSDHRPHRQAPSQARHLPRQSPHHLARWTSRRGAARDRPRPLRRQVAGEALGDRPPEG